MDRECREDKPHLKLDLFRGSFTDFMSVSRAASLTWSKKGLITVGKTCPASPHSDQTLITEIKFCFLRSAIRSPAILHMIDFKAESKILFILPRFAEFVTSI